MEKRQFVAEIKRVRERVRRFVISTSSPDRDSDTIAVGGWKLDAYRRNPVVLWAHDYAQLPIGRSLDVRVEGETLTATAEFAPSDIHPFAGQVLGLIDAGYLPATSVGFRPIKWKPRASGGTDFIEQELLEFSIVPVPANSEALIVGRAPDARAVKRWLGSGDDEPALFLTDGDDDQIEFNERDLIAAIQAAVPGLARDAVARANEEVARSLARARGRVVDDGPFGDPSARRHHRGGGSAIFDVDRGAVAAIIRRAVSEATEPAALARVVRQATEQAIARHTGRVD